MTKGETIKTDTRRWKHKDKGLDQVDGNAYLAYNKRSQGTNIEEEAKLS